jgi:GH43 family beta-xylosidase
MPILTQTLEAPVPRTSRAEAFEIELPIRARDRRGPGVFTNPIIAPPSADPWVFQWNGAYYYCESRDQKAIWIRKADSFIDLGETEGELIWTAPALGANSNAVWAPELHRINDRWYIYYAADDGLNENHRMWVLESVTDDPMGQYRCKGSVETNGWAIDGTVLQRDGRLYFLWSGWPGAVNGCQNLYIAQMSNPWTISSERVLLGTPTHAWEKVEMDINEGPQILERHGKLFVIYSASGSWTADYCLGLLELTGADVLNPRDWKKWDAPALARNKEVWGLGHCSFTQSPDGAEDWIVFHAKTKKKAGWCDRNVHAQRFSWTEQGHPFFGEPIAAGVEISLPAIKKQQPARVAEPMVAA